MDLANILNGELVGKILVGFMILNIVLSAAGKVLEALKLQDKFPILAKISGLLQKVVDWVSANRSHK